MHGFSQSVQANGRIKKGVAVTCDSFQIALLMNWVEYKKQNNYRISVVKYHLMCFFFLIRSPKQSSWHAVHSSDCYQKLTITSQQMFVSGFHFDLDVLFHPLTWLYSELNCN